MILKTCFLLVVSVAWEVSGASFSKVYVQNGPEVAPFEYYKYGASPLSYEYPSSSVAQYNAAPIGYEYPFGQSYSYRTVYPEQTIAPVASIAPAVPSANYATYGAPVSNVPLVYGRNEPGSSYSYVLVNQDAGQELKYSDGEVIRGGFSIFQPEGLVEFVADNNQGSNAIFKTYIPNDAVAYTEMVNHESAHHETAHHETAHQKSVHHAEPCHEAKSEALTALESHEEGHKEHHGEHEHEEKHESHHEGHDSNNDSHEARHGGHKEPEVHEYILHNNDHDHERIIVIEAEDRHHGSEPGEHHATEHESHDHEGSEHESHSHHESDHESHHDSDHTSHEHEDDDHHHEEHEGHDHHESDHENHDHHESEHDSHSHHQLEHESYEHHEGQEKPTHEIHNTHEAIVEISHEPHENHEHHEGHVAPQVPALAGNNVYIPYNDFLKCIQAAMARGNTHPHYPGVPKPTSPLTYLVFNKPC